MANPPHIPKLLVLSGPSGVGKSTVIGELLRRYPDRLRLSISATTRPPREAEADGVDYYFLTSEEFARRREAGQFLECCEVFGHGHWYGTLLSEVTPSPGDEKWVILDIDVQGADKLRRKYPSVPTIFLHPGSEAELERRLRARGTESEAAIQRRLEVARAEMAQADRYRFQVTNDTVDDAIAQISRILAELDFNEQQPESNNQESLK